MKFVKMIETSYFRIQFKLQLKVCDFRRPDWFRRGLLVGPLVKRDECSKLLHNSITALHHSMILEWHLWGCYKVMHHIIQVYYTVASIIYSGCSNVCPIAYPFCIMAYKVLRRGYYTWPQRDTKFDF